MMNYKITYKALDNKKVYSLQIINWGYKWYCMDTSIPEIKEKQQATRDRYNAEHAGDPYPDPFLRGPKLPFMPVAFNKKVREKMGEVVKGGYRRPTTFIFENVEYNISNGTLWINDMTHFEKLTFGYNRGNRE
jgi:hypothetical protein